VRGAGRSLGAALDALYRQVDPTAGRRRASYTATGWHAQLVALTGTRAGMRAADVVGLSPTRRTLIRWLSHSGRGDETGAPSSANRTLIGRAYGLLSDGIDVAAWESAMRRTIEIRGVVAMGRDVRDRGRGGSSPLRIDGTRGDWTAVARAWDGGRQELAGVERTFIWQVISQDIGETSDGITFPGDWYTVEV
jgi:hypothetical protein